MYFFLFFIKEWSQLTVLSENKRSQLSIEQFEGRISMKLVKQTPYANIVISTLVA